MSDDKVIVTTDCLYPSFEQVKVSVGTRDNIFVVSDCGGVVATVLAHGKQGTAIPQALAKIAKRHRLQTHNNYLEAEVPSIDWISAAVLSVANASAIAAFEAIQGEEFGERVANGND
jgi:hypothetical protein